MLNVVAFIWALTTLTIGKNAIIPPVDYFGDAGFESDGVTKIPVRFDYRQTLKYPFFASSKPPGPKIPYFNKSGDVIVTNNLLRISPSLHNKKGLIWCETPNPHREWMVEFSFSVYGRGASGGEGIVIWYAKDLNDHDRKSSHEFYGASGSFTGIALVLDSSDSAANRHNPFIYVVDNNGAKTSKDFVNYASTSVHLGSCFREFRNTPGRVYGKLVYDGGMLRFDVDIRQNGQSYTNCFKVPVSLPTGYHFGVSASTSKSTYSSSVDDHDVYSFETYQLRPPKKEKHLRPHEEEDIHAGKEFKMDEKIQEKIEKFEQAVAHEEAELGNAAEETAAFNAETVLRIEENQFHILEALNLIETKLGIVPVDLPTSQELRGSQSLINDELKTMRGELSTLRTDLRSLHRAIEDLKQSMEHLLGRLDNKVSSAGVFLQDTHANSSSIGFMVKIVGFFVALCLFLILYSTCTRAGSDKIKKFV